MIVVTGSVTARRDSFEEVRRLSLEHVHRSRGEPGCISHAVHVDCENPLRLVFFEQWTDRAALLEHFGVPASRDFVKSLQSLAAAATTIEPYDYQAREILGAWLYCHMKFILQCNIRGPRYLGIRCEAPEDEGRNFENGTRRVRRDPPTLEEAIFAAVGIADDRGNEAKRRRADGTAVRGSSG
jgi:quinol monooxygenase YgiN